MESLRFKIEPLPHPYAAHDESKYELWGRLTIVTGQKQILLRTQWNLEGLVEWFIAHYAEIVDDVLDVLGNKPQPTENLAEAWLRIRLQGIEEDNLLEDARMTEIDRYMAVHDLARILRGAGIPSIFLGCRDSVGEISLTTTNISVGEGNYDFYVQPSAWSYRFDMLDFLISLKQNMQGFLREWSIAGFATDVGRQYADRLVENLDVIDVKLACCSKS